MLAAKVLKQALDSGQLPCIDGRCHDDNFVRTEAVRRFGVGGVNDVRPAEQPAHRLRSAQRSTRRTEHDGGNAPDPLLMLFHATSAPLSLLFSKTVYHIPALCDMIIFSLCAEMGAGANWEGFCDEHTSPH